MNIFLIIVKISLEEKEDILNERIQLSYRINILIFICLEKKLIRRGERMCGEIVKF